MEGADTKIKKSGRVHTSKLMNCDTYLWIYYLLLFFYLICIAIHVKATPTFNIVDVSNRMMLKRHWRIAHAQCNFQMLFDIGTEIEKSAVMKDKWRPNGGEHSLSLNDYVGVQCRYISVPLTGIPRGLTRPSSS